METWPVNLRSACHAGGQQDAATTELDRVGDRYAPFQAEGTSVRVTR